MSGESFYVTGGTLPGDAPSYVERRADRELHDGLAGGDYCYVLTSRQMGKSSLMVRTAARLQQGGAAVAVLDLTALGQNLTADQWYEGMLNLMGQQLGLEDALDDYWLAHERVGPLQRFMRALGDVVLPSAGAKRLVVFIDEIDAVRSLPFSTDEFFAAIRECYNRRSSDPRYAGLTFCLLGVATPGDLIRDTRTTPFNIGRRIELSDFAPAEAQGLAPGLPGEKRRKRGLLQRVLHWTAGHPYLTQRLCLAVAAAGAVTPADVDRLCRELFLSAQARERDDNLLFVRDRLLRSEVELAALLDLYGRIRRGDRVPPDDTNRLVDVLRLSGVVRLGAGIRPGLEVRNRIYADVFDREWVVQHMPDAEVRRQRAAYRRGLRRAAALGAAVVIAMGALTGTALTQAGIAQAATRDARHSLGVANSEGTRARQLAASLASTNGELQDALRKTRKALTLAEQRRVDAVLARGQAQRSAVLAMAQEQRANREAAVATAATGRAEEEQHNAERARRRAEAEAESSRETAYTAQVPQAQAAVDAGIAWRARELLAAQVPHRGQTDLRGFEWRYLWGRSADTSERTFHGPPGTLINAIAFSPNGRLLAIGQDRTIELRDTSTGMRVGSLDNLGAHVSSLAFSPAGRLLGVGLDDGRAELRDLKTGRQVANITGINGWVRFVAFSGDGGYFFAAGDTARAWDVRAARLAAVLPTNGRTALAVSRRGSRAVVAVEGGPVRVIDTAAWKQTDVFPTDPTGNWAIALAPDGHTLATGTRLGKIQLWDLDQHPAEGERRPLAQVQAPSGWILSLAFSPDGRMLASAGFDGTLCLWDVQSRTLIRTLAGHPGSIERVVFSPDGQRVASAGRAGLTKVWQAEPRQTDAVLPISQSTPTLLAADLRHMLEVDERSAAMVVTDLRTGARTTLKDPKGATYPLLTQPFSADGRALYGFTYDNLVVRRRVTDHSPLGQVSLRREFSHYDVSSSGRFLAEGDDRVVIVEDLATGRELARWETGPVDTCRVSENGKVALTVHLDGTGLTTIRFWSVGSSRGRDLVTTRDQVAQGRLSSDGSRFALQSSTTGTVTVWDVASGAQIRTFPTAGPWCIQNPGLQRILTFNDAGRGVLWDVDTGRELGTYRPQARVLAVRLTPDGERAVTLTMDPQKKQTTFYLWDLRTSRERLLATVPDLVMPAELTMLADGRSLVYARQGPDGEAGTICALDLDSGSDRVLATCGAGVSYEAVTPDGSAVVVREFSSAVRRWELPSGRGSAVAPRFPAGLDIYAVSSVGPSLIGLGRGKVVVARADTGRPFITQPVGPSWYFLLSNGGRYLAVRDRAGMLVVWDLATRRSYPWGSGVDILDSSGDDRLLLCRSGSDLVLRELPAGGIRFRFQGAPGEQLYIAATSADGRLVAWGGSDRYIHLADTTTGAELAVLRGHTGAVNQVAFSPDGRTLASAGTDRALRLWNLRKRQEVLRVPLPDEGSLVGFSADGRLLVYRESRQLRVWRAPTLAEIEKDPEAAPAGPAMARAGDAQLLREIQAHHTLAAPGAPDLLPRAGGAVRWTRLFVDVPARPAGTLRNLPGGVTCVNVTGTGSVNLDRYNLNLVSGHRYALQFRARADRPRTPNLVIAEDRPPWRRLGLEQPLDLDERWRPFRFTFTVPENAPDHGGALAIFLGGTLGKVYFADLSLVELPAPPAPAAAPALLDETRAHFAPQAGPNLIAYRGEHPDWKLHVEPGAGAAAAAAREPEGVTRVEVRRAGGSSWDVRLVAPGLAMQPGHHYVLQLRARASAPRRIILRTQPDGPAIDQQYVQGTMDVGNEWSVTRLFFDALPNIRPGTAITTFEMREPGTYWFADALVAERSPDFLADEYLRPAAAGQAVDVLPEHIDDLNVEGGPRSGTVLAIADLEGGLADVRKHVLPNRPAVLTPNLLALATDVDWDLLLQSEKTRARQAPQPDGSVCLEVQSAATHESWAARVLRRGLPLRPGRRYVVQFRARADANRSLQVYAVSDIDPWPNVGLDQRVELTSEWRPYRLLFEANQQLPQLHAEIDFAVGAELGKTWIADILVTPEEPGTTEIALSDHAAVLATYRRRLDHSDETAGVRNLLPQTGPLAGWTLAQDTAKGPQGQAKIEPDGSLRVQLRRLGDLALERTGFHLEEGREYALVLRVRSERPRGMGVYVDHVEGGVHSAGVATPIRIPAAWTTVSWFFRATRAGREPCRLRLVFSDPGSLWIADTALLEIRTPAEAARMRADAQARRLEPGSTPANLFPYRAGIPEWSLVQAGGQAEKAADGDGSARVKVQKAGPDAESVALVRKGLPLHPSTHYVLQFRARAGAPLPLSVRVISDGNNRGDGGVSAVVGLAPEWRTFRFPFVATPGAAETATLTLGMGLLPGAVRVADVLVAAVPPAIPPRESAATPDQVDLSAFYNASLVGGWHPMLNRVGNDLGDLPTGLQRLAGTVWDIRGVVQLGAESWTEFPPRVTGIPVGRECRRVSFLVSASLAVRDGQEVGDFVLRFADGRSMVVPLRYGRHLRDWWEAGPTPEAELAWIGHNEAQRIENQTASHIRLWKVTADVPEGMGPLETIDLEAARTACAPFVVAITTEPGAESPVRDGAAAAGRAAR